MAEGDPIKLNTLTSAELNVAEVLMNAFPTSPEHSQSGLAIQCIKNTEQIGNRSQICKLADAMKFLVQIDYFGTYDVE